MLKCNESLSSASRKGQLSQAFTYIAIIIVIGAIAALGAKSILSLLSANCDAKKADFTVKISKFIDDYSDKGSIVSESLALPCDVMSVCFVDSAAMTPAFVAPDIVIQESVRDSSYNIFVKGEFTVPIANAPKLSVDGGGIICMNASSGYVKLRFSGNGKKTVVSRG